MEVRLRTSPVNDYEMSSLIGEAPEMSLLIGEAPGMSLLIPESLLVRLSSACQLLSVSSCTSSAADVFDDGQYDPELCATKVLLLAQQHQQY